MVHCIEIDDTSDPIQLRKLFRKKLMTGGAVIRLRPGLSTEALEDICRRFIAGAQPHNVEEMVLAEVAKSPAVNEELLRRLHDCNLPTVNRTLIKIQRNA